MNGEPERDDTLVGIFIIAAIIVIAWVLMVVLGCSVSRTVVEVDVKHAEATMLQNGDNVKVTVEIGARAVTAVAAPIRTRSGSFDAPAPD